MLKLESLNIDNYSIISRQYETAYYQTLEEVPGARKTTKKIKKYSENYLKKLLKIEILKS